MKFIHDPQNSKIQRFISKNESASMKLPRGLSTPDNAPTHAYISASEEMTSRLQ